jgi:DNA-binding response OmpR family regulator
MSVRVLIVDDETNIRRMMRLTLEADGYEIDEAPDGLKGLEVFGDGSRFDTVLLDQKMTGMSGIDTLRQIRSRAPAARVIMITAFGSIELAVEAMKEGATDFLRKPLTPETLRGAVAAALSKPPQAQRAPMASPRPSVPIELPPVEIWTVNGFFIRSLPHPDGAAGNEHHFRVRHAQRGPQGEVLVTINPAEVFRVDRATKRQLSAAGAFWHQRAERALMNYLFQHAALPPDNRLVVDRVGDDAVGLADAWTGA